MIFSGAVAAVKRRLWGSSSNDDSGNRSRYFYPNPGQLPADDVTSLSVFPGDSVLMLGDFNDRGVSLEDRAEGTLLQRAYTRFDGANEDLSGRINGFMQEYVFGDNELNDDLDEVIGYLGTLSSVGDVEGSAAAKTARTILSHQRDYVSRQKGRLDRFDKQGFLNYLFGEKGVLTTKRLEDMKRATDFVAKNSNKLEAHKDYRLKVDNSDFDKLTASYSRGVRGEVLVNVNQDNSMGMSTSNGDIYWDYFDKMLGEGVSAKSTLTHYVKCAVINDHVEGQSEMFVRRDYKSGNMRNYARYLS